MAERQEAQHRFAAPSLWHAGLPSLVASIRLAALRLTRSWRLLLVVELGMAIAVALLAAIPFYSDLVAGAQLQRILTSAASTDRNIQLDVTVSDPSVGRLAAIDHRVSAIASDQVGSITTSATEYLQVTSYFSLQRVDGADVRVALPTYPLRFRPQDLLLAFDYAQALPHMRLLAGRLPLETPSAVYPEVLVTPRLGVAPGATLQLSDSLHPQSSMTVRVVGVWFPRDEHDPFWNGYGFDSIIPPNINKPYAVPPPPPQFPILFARQTMVQALDHMANTSTLRPAVGLRYIYFVAPGQMSVDSARNVTVALLHLRQSLDTDVYGAHGVTDVAVATHLSDLIGDVVATFIAQTQPLYSVDALLVALVLLFIFVMAGLLAESQAGEIATLKSRGASTLQVLLTYLLAQSAVLVGVALLMGSVVAGWLALALARLFVPVSGGEQVAFTPVYVARSLSLRDALIPAAVGAGLGVLALGLATWQAARMDALAFRRAQGRSERVPFWKRYYLDLGLALLCVAGYTELASFGSLGLRAQFGIRNGSAPATLIQLLAPTLLLLAGALLVQRALPLVVRLGAWLTARGRGATGLLAFAQAARAGSAFGRLTLLLTLAVGLGLFALTFQTSIARSAHDNAYYLTGADERVSIAPQSEGTQSTLGYAAKMARMPGVHSVSPLFRGVALTLPNQGGANIDVLGVDPATFAQTGAWRSDYASQALPSLMRILARAQHGANVGQSDTPLVAIVDQEFASYLTLQVGSRFLLAPQESSQSSQSSESSVYFVVGAIVNDFPTLYDEYGGGYIVVDEADYLTALASPSVAGYSEQVNGPNGFLLRTSPDAHLAAERTRALADPNFFVQQTWDARQLTAFYRADPLAAGMSGLLLLGALIAALLALVGVVTQAGVAARQRQTQFAILRTFGLSASALTRMLLTEQALVYVLGALGGVVIGALLSVASLPFLGFATATYTPPVLGVPSSVLAVNLHGSLLFLAALGGIFIVALVVAGLLARATGLGRALRVGED